MSDRWHEIAAATRRRELAEFLARPEPQATAEETANDEAWLSAVEMVHDKPWSELRHQIRIPHMSWHEPTIHTQADRDEWAQPDVDDYQGGPVAWDDHTDHYDLSA